MESWKTLIEKTLKTTGESLSDLETTLTPEELIREFNEGYGSSNGAPFTAWSKDYVYFPVTYDGFEWVGFVPRNQNGEASYHWGGE